MGWVDWMGGQTKTEKYEQRKIMWIYDGLIENEFFVCNMNTHTLRLEQTQVCERVGAVADFSVIAFI